MKLSLAAAAVAAGCGANVAAASLTSFDWGLHDTLESASVQPIGKLDNTFFFTLAQDFDLFSGAVSNNLQRPADLKGGLVSLFSQAGALGSGPIGSYTFDGSTEGVLHAFGRLVAGEYQYRVSGMGTGANGGAYTIRSMVQVTKPDAGLAATTAPTQVVAPALVPALELAVPEPQSGLLALAGLGAMALGMNRRKGAAARRTRLA